MKHQLEFDFEATEKERELYAYWAELETKAKIEFSDETLCLCWCSDGKPDWEWWNALPNYKKEHYMNMWKTYRGTRKAHQVLNDKPNMQIEEIAQKWAQEIKEAAINGKSCPFFIDEITGKDKIFARQILSRAYQIANVVIIKEENKEGGKHAHPLRK